MLIPCGNLCDNCEALSALNNWSGGIVADSLTLRDWFAGQCMSSAFVGVAKCPTEETVAYRVSCCKSAYEWADEMIKAREGK